MLGWVLGILVWLFVAVLCAVLPRVCGRSSRIWCGE